VALAMRLAALRQVIWMQAHFFSPRPEIHYIADLLIGFFKSVYDAAIGMGLEPV